MRRSGNVCDTLVFLLVAVLLPAWLLGHLYLALFPSSGSNATSPANTAGAVVSLSGENSSSDKPSTDGAIGLLDDTTSSSAADVGQQAAKWQEELASFKTKFSSLSSENQNLTMKATEFKGLKLRQEREIAQLKSQLEQISNQGGAEKIASMSTELQNTKNDYAQLDKELKSIEQEKSQLASQVMELKSKNQQLAESAGSGNRNEGLQQKLEAQVQNLENKLRESTDKLAEQKRLMEQMQGERPGDSETAEALVAASKKLLGDANQEKTRLQVRVNELITALESTKSNLASQKKQLADSNTRLEQVNAKYALTLKRLATNNSTPPNQTNGSATSKPPGRIETPRPTTAVPPAKEQYRNYVSSRGNQSRLAFVQWIGNDQVVVRSFANKQLYQVPIERFSVSDQAYLQSLKLMNGQ